MIRRIGSSTIVVLSVLAAVMERDIYTASTDSSSSTAIEISRGQPINSGFVFCNGQYIEAPYKLTIKGLDLYLNDILLQPYAWMELPPATSITVAPKIPKDITKNTSMHDKAYLAYIGQMGQYLEQKYPKELDEAKHMKEALEALPCVKSVAVGADTRYSTVTLWNGDSIGFRLAGFQGRRMPRDRKSLMVYVGERRKDFERWLRSGECIFFSGRGGRSHVGGNSAREVLPRLKEIVESNLDDERKMAEIRKIIHVDVYIGKEQLPQLRKDFSDSAQLGQRVKALTKPRP